MKMTTEIAEWMIVKAFTVAQRAGMRRVGWWQRALMIDHALNATMISRAEPVVKRGCTCGWVGPETEARQHLIDVLVTPRVTR